jgi:hypothetical protein
MALAAGLALVASGCAAHGITAVGATRRTEVHSVEEFLAALPESLRAHYVLLFETRSPQGGSYEAPRAILYGEDASNVVAFSERPNAIDLMFFDRDSASFVFREVTFPQIAGARSMRISEPNPERCRVCHGTPAHPLWDTYPLWPGAYGEGASGPPTPEERAAYARFERGMGAHPRYRYLRPHHESSLEAAERHYRGDAVRANNVEFGELLGALQAKAIAKELRASTNFERTRYALLYALTPRCRELDGTSSLGVLGEDAAEYAAFAAASQRANWEQAIAKRHRAHGAAALQPIAAADSTAMTRLRFVTEHELGIPTDSWTLALERGTYDYRVSDRPSASIESHLFTEIAGAGERAVELLADASDARSLCDYLAGHAREAARSARVP